MQGDDAIRKESSEDFKVDKKSKASAKGAEEGSRTRCALPRYLLGSEAQQPQHKQQSDGDDSRDQHRSKTAKAV